MYLKVIFFLISSTFFLYGLSKQDKIIRASLYPYSIKGITYYPHKIHVGEQKEVLASWYGEYFHGRKTAMGEIYDMYAYTAAHKTYPLGTVVLVTNPKNGKSLKVRINDRGPFWNDRGLDLSMGAAEFLDTKEKGVAKVHMEVLSVPHIAMSNISKKNKIPLHPTYNIGYSAISYTSINKTTTKAPFEIGSFQNKKEAKVYLKKLSKHLPKASLLKDNFNYKIEFFLSSNEQKAIKKLKKLKKIGLITGYGVCWSYD